MDITFKDLLPFTADIYTGPLNLYVNRQLHSEIEWITKDGLKDEDGVYLLFKPRTHVSPALGHEYHICPKNVRFAAKVELLSCTPSKDQKHFFAICYGRFEKK